MGNKGNTKIRKFVPGVYRHFKGGMYLALMLGKDSETAGDVVIYCPLYVKEGIKPTVWVRSLEDFMGLKEFEDGTKVIRFELVSKS